MMKSRNTNQSYWNVDFQFNVQYVTVFMGEVNDKLSPYLLTKNGLISESFFTLAPIRVGSCDNCSL